MIMQNQSQKPNPKAALLDFFVQRPQFHVLLINVVLDQLLELNQAAQVSPADLENPVELLMLSTLSFEVHEEGI